MINFHYEVNKSVFKYRYISVSVVLYFFFTSYGAYSLFFAGDGNHIGCQGLNRGVLCAKQIFYPLY